MEDAKVYSINGYGDQHITDIAFGHRKVEMNGETKEIISIFIRGTNSSTEEWSSNFDIGCDDIFYNNNPVAKNRDWVNAENHMGFDITATRVIRAFNEYLTTYADNFDRTAQKTLWLTGHSRGGAIANIVGARLIDQNYEAFVYTFAPPTSTTVSEDTAKTYKSIFNTINEDDIITYLPISNWGFRRYGNDRIISVEDTCKGTWEYLTGKNYKSNRNDMFGLIGEFYGMSRNRNDCYKYTCSCHGNGSDNSIRYFTLNFHPTVIYGRDYQKTERAFAGFFGFDRCETPAYFMQYLARLASAGDDLNRVLTATTFCSFKYLDIRIDFIKYALSGNMESPHLPVSYYLLSAGR